MPTGEPIFDHVKAITESAKRLNLSTVQTIASCSQVMLHAAVSTGATDREILEMVSEQLLEVRQARREFSNGK